MSDEWTLQELAERAAQALAAASVHAPNGRVTGVPDARLIRWYSTIGLVDRPSGARGRTALYGPRHLLQLVAVKRLQANGLPLAEIQATLAGATEATLRRIADLPGTADRPGSADRSDSAGDPPPRRFWAQPPAQPKPALLTGVPLDGGSVLLVPGTPSEADVAAIQSAARPLLELLAARGLSTMDRTEGAPA